MFRDGRALLFIDKVLNSYSQVPTGGFAFFLSFFLSFFAFSSFTMPVRS